MSTAHRLSAAAIAIATAVPITARAAPPRPPAPPPAAPPAARAPAAPAPADTPSDAPAPAASQGGRLLPVAWIDAGGLFAQGQDLTDGSTRQGGGYIGGFYAIAEKVPIALRYTVSVGGVVERMAFPTPDRKSATTDVPVNQGRHSIDLSVGYRILATRGKHRLWITPFASPRALFLIDKVSPAWAFELGGGLRAGLYSADVIDISAFGAAVAAVAKQADNLSVYGQLVSEWRFGAEAVIRTAGPIGLVVGYEGDVVAYQHQNATYHQVLGGLRFVIQ